MDSSLYVPESHLRLAETPNGTLLLSLSGHLLALLGPPVWIACTAVPDGLLPAGVPFATIESDKTAYEISLPFPAVFSGLNPRVADDPALLDGTDPDGWLCKIRPRTEAWREGLLDADAYAALVAP